MIKQFLKFALVGLTGTLIHLAILYYLTEFLGIYYLISAVVAFVVASSNNFFWNKIWTFDEKIGDKTARKYVQFVIVSVVALLVNLFFLYLFTEFLGIYYLISQVIAIALSLWINFFGNRIWTFRK